MNALEATKEQLDHLYELREAHRQRLAVLQVRAAQFGIDAPPHVSNEIKEIDGDLAELNRKIVLLEGSLPGQQQLLEPPPAESLQPTTVVPATINERLLMLTMELVRMQDEMRKNFQALHVAQAKDTDSLWHAITDTRDEIAVEREERRDWQEQERMDREDWQERERAARKHRQQVIYRWLWVIGGGLVFLLVLVVILSVVEYVRDVLLASQGR